jgi:hypothetical protein
MRTTGSHWRRAALIGGIVGGVIVARTFGPAACLRLENLFNMLMALRGHGTFLLGWTQAERECDRTGDSGKCSRPPHLGADTQPSAPPGRVGPKQGWSLELAVVGRNAGAGWSDERLLSNFVLIPFSYLLSTLSEWEV